jgi:hypothetical protein
MTMRQKAQIGSLSLKGHKGICGEIGLWVYRRNMALFIKKYVKPSANPMTGVVVG